MVLWGSRYLAAGLRLVPLLPRGKRPYAAKVPDILTGWQIRYINSEDEWRDFLSVHPMCNVGTQWPGVQIDIDAPEAQTWAEKHGLQNKCDVWTIITGRGTRYLFAPSTTQFSTVIDASHLRPDFLAPGRLAVLPPSVHPNGKVYTWLDGRSPTDIPYRTLPQMPLDLADGWSSCVQLLTRVNLNTAAPSWLALVFESICEHLRHEGHHLRQMNSGSVVTSCPFHDDRHPSFSFHPERGWICFAGCGKGRLTELAAKLGIRVGSPR